MKKDLLCWKTFYYLIVLTIYLMYLLKKVLILIRYASFGRHAGISGFMEYSANMKMPILLLYANYLKRKLLLPIVKTLLFR